MTVAVNIPAEGAMAPPPPDAPMETSVPLTEQAIQEQVAKARAHEKELAPLVFQKTEETAGGVIRPRLESLVAGKEITGLDPFYAAMEARKAAEPKTTTPAASDSDSPSRGLPGTAPVPPERSREMLKPTGGFGDAGEAMYFPLTGPELKTLVETLMDEVHQRIQNDLRFSVAQCYPRVTAKVQIVIEGETTDGGFVVQKVAEKHETPLEVAQRFGDSVVFVVAAYRREFSPDGSSEEPPDAIRDSLGLPKPRKQAVLMGGLKETMADMPISVVGF